MPIIFKTDRAREDLINIWRYTYREWGEQQADHYCDGLAKAFELLAETPQVRRLRTELTPPVRIHHVKHHLIVYLEIEGGIRLIRILHGSMEMDSHLDSGSL